MIYKITKLGFVQDPFDKNNHFGDSEPFYLGFFIEKPKLGKRFELLGISFKNGKQDITTSMVTKIINNDEFETLNLRYRIEEYKNNKYDIR